jgi:hypothetical protein
MGGSVEFHRAAGEGESARRGRPCPSMCERMDWPRWDFSGLRRGAGWAGGADRWGGAPPRREARDGGWREGWWFRRGRDARGCDGACGFALRVCGEVGGAGEDFGLERAEALQAVGEACQDERGVGSAEGAHEAREVLGLGALAERGGDALGPEDEHADDEEQEEGGGRRPIGPGPGGGGCWGGEGGRG